MEEERIYVASRASLPERPAMWRELRALGHNIISTWIDESDEVATASFMELWDRVAKEVRSATRLVLYVEPDDFPLKGALIEVGIAIGADVPVFVVAPGVKLEERSMRPLGSWVMHPLVQKCDSVADAMTATRWDRK